VVMCISGAAALVHCSYTLCLLQQQRHVASSLIIDCLQVSFLGERVWCTL
jgi:hypothetical protein